MVDAPLEWFGRYVILEPLGQGGMGRVDLALRTEGGVEQLVVLKRLRADQESSPEAVAMLRREAKLAARLAHPNLVRAVGIEETCSEIAMVMEYVEGHTLVEVTRAHHRRESRIPLQVSLRIVCDVLLGLEWAHSLRGDDGRPLRLVHRDVTPHNVVLTYRGHSKLIDFGLAKVANAAGQTTAGFVKGKLGYMAPEQVLGEPLDRRTDVFAVGVILWELLAGRRFLRGANATWEYVSRAWWPPPSVRDVAPVEAELATIVDRALARAPDQRFSSASELRLALDAYAAPNDLLATPREVARHLTSILGGAHDERRERVLERYMFVHGALREGREALRPEPEPVPAHALHSSSAPVTVDSRPYRAPPRARSPAWSVAVAAALCLAAGVASYTARLATLASSAVSRANHEKRLVEQRFDSVRAPRPSAPTHGAGHARAGSR